MELLERFALGEREAFETLFREYQREVFGWCMRIVRDRGVAEDLTVEAFWKMHRAHARFDPKRSFGACVPKQSLGTRNRRGIVPRIQRRRNS